MSSKILVLLLIVTCLPLPFMRAQDPAPDDPPAEPKSAAITMNQLIGSPAERFMRAWQYKYQYAEQPSLVSVGSGSNQMLIPNPEHNLNQHSFTFDFSQAFLSSQQMAQAIAAYRDVNGKEETNYHCKMRDPHDQTHSKIVPDLHCVVEAGGWWKRKRPPDGAGCLSSGLQRPDSFGHRARGRLGGP